jgi:hypothetical protein
LHLTCVRDGNVCPSVVSRGGRQDFGCLDLLSRVNVHPAEGGSLPNGAGWESDLGAAVAITETTPCVAGIDELNDRGHVALIYPAAA